MQPLALAKSATGPAIPATRVQEPLGTGNRSGVPAGGESRTGIPRVRSPVPVTQEFATAPSASLAVSPATRESAHRAAAGWRAGDRLVELDHLPPVRDLRLEVERLDLRLDRDLGLGVAVDEEHASRESRCPGPFAVPEVRQPIEQLALVGVGREPADRPDLATDLAHLAVDPDLRCACLEVGAERALTLVADEQQDGLRVADEVSEMAQDAPAGQHPIRGHDHVRPRRRLDRLRIADMARLDLPGIVERRVALTEKLRGLLVVRLRVAAVDVGGFRRHRRVEVERQRRDLALLEHPVELPDDLLGP